ncbi:adenylate/guanylate cyclase domain-containing protein, partial [Paenibacillus sepulcri]|nr:adenylate/guanylate cyclase domain-containing protein [Paenibacillus sepulcri]
MGNGKPEVHLVMEKQFALSKSRIWEILSNTNRINRAIGLDPVIRGELRDHRSISRAMKSTALRLLPMEWQEYPFEWKERHWYEVYRHYSRGPMKTFRSGIQLSEADNGGDGEPLTNVKLYSTVTTANWAMYPPVRLLASQSMKKTIQYIERAIAADSYKRVPSLPAAGKAPHAPGVNAQRLSELMERLAPLGFKQTLLQELEMLVLNGHEDDTADIRPFVLAAKWKAERNEVLKLLLHATTQGMFNMEWQLICPNCRVAETGANRLSAIHERYHCEWCGIDYEAMFDRYVELCFSVHPEIRRSSRAVYCIGAPAFSPHIFMQRLIGSGERTDLELPEQDIDWRIRILRSNEWIHLKLDSAPQEQHDKDSHPVTELTINEQGWAQESAAGYCGGGIRIANERDHEVIVVIEREGWDDLVATASHVTLLPEFRSLFSSDVLAPGQQAGISSLTVLFTDLCGSTAYYEQVGDASAYGYVRQMFDFLSATVELHRGAVVKTIGDAVMAVFDRAEDGMAAAL